jgi:hypothetical protein
MKNHPSNSTFPVPSSRPLRNGNLWKSCVSVLLAVALGVPLAHAQYADWDASPPKILPNERPGSGVALVSGSGRQFMNKSAFAALKADGSIVAWGNASNGGSGAPTDTGYKAIYSTESAFAALRNDGSITAWGNSSAGGSGAPTDDGYIEIYSCRQAFAARKENGSIRVWGAPGPQTGAPTGTGFTTIRSGDTTFSALKADDTLATWGGVSGLSFYQPKDSGYKSLYSGRSSFAAMKDDGSIAWWQGAGTFGGPTAGAYTRIYTTGLAFAAMKTDGRIVGWGNADYGGSGAPTASGFKEIYSNEYAFAALTANGSITAWGNATNGGSGAPTDSGYTSISSTYTAFAALKADGTIKTWGFGISGTPTDGEYTAIYSNAYSFAALKADGSIKSWGQQSNAPVGKGFVAIYSTDNAFAALKDDGSISAWGSSGWGGTTAPTGKGFRSIQSVIYQPTFVFEPELKATLGTITSTSAVAGATITTMAGKTAVSRGVVYAPVASNADPSMGGVSVTQVVESPLGSDLTFDVTISGLSGNTHYAYKAYVTDTEGESYYSPLASFSTNLPPVILSNGGSSTAALSVPENSTAVTTISATDGDAGQAVSYAISGGTDAVKFTIHPTTGVLTFVTAPDYEAPTDADGDNIYQVIVAATDDGNPPKSATQTLSVTVTNVADSGAIAIEQPVDSNLAPGATVAFGSATLGQPLDRVFTVRSSGEVPLVLSNAVFSGSHAGDFSLVGAMPSTIAVGGTATFTVRFRPSGSGARSAALNLSNNDQSPGKSPFAINLSGSGTATSILATYATPASQVSGGWVNDGNFTIGQVGTTNPGNNWPSNEGPDKAVDNNTGSKFLHFRNNNAGVILRPTNSSVVFNRLALFTANDAPERDPASYVIYGSAEALGGSSGTNIQLSSLTKIAEGTVTMLSNRNAGPTMIQFANSTAYTSYVVVFPTVRTPASTTLTQISEIQLQQGANPPGVVPMSDARGGQLVAASFSFGTIGNSNPGTNWLAGESPDRALDGNVNTKFAMFRSTGAGLISSPQAAPAVVNSLTFWTANDSPERDPVEYQIYGFSTRVTQMSGTLDVGTAGTLLSSGNLTLPAERNSGPVQVDFANSTAYASYLVVFPEVKNSPATNLTQISEIQFGYVPFVSLSPASLAPFTTNFSFPSTAQGVSLSGLNLDGNVSVTAPAGFEISTDGSTYAPSLTLAPADRALTAALSVRISGVHAQVGPLEGNLQVTTPGGSPRSLPLSGTVVAAVKPSAQSLAGFQTDFGSGSASQVLTLSGGGLSGALTVRAPTGFEVSADGTNFSPSLQLGKNAGTIQSVYRGDFAKETTAAGKIWVAGTGIEFPANSAFAAITSNGAVVTWGGATLGGNSSSVSSQLGSGVTAVYSTKNAFAAVKADGSVVAWGNTSNGGNSSAVASQLSSGVMAVSSTAGAFAALKADGSVVTWGNTFYGGDSSSVSSQLSSGVTAVYSNTSAFAAVKTDGSVVTWGSSTFGGDSSAVESQLGSGVTAVYSTNLAFAALKEDHSIVTWGNAGDGGDSSAVSSQLGSGVTAVFSNERAFAALTTNGSVVTWGNATYGGDSIAVASQLGSGVTAVFSTERAFAALKTNGSIVTWGQGNYGGNSIAVASQLGSGVTAVYSNSAAFAALKTNGSIVTWGFAGYGGDSGSVTSQLSSGVTAVYSTDSAFAALKAVGSVVTWGGSNGGDSSSVASQLSADVTRVYSSLFAFAALKADGSVVTWGDANSGGSGGPDNIGVAVLPTLPLTLHVRLAANAPGGTVSGELELTSSGIATQTVALSGTVVPVLTASSESLLGFEAPLGSASASQTLTLSGGGFPRPLTVTAPAGFEVSKDGTNFSSSVRLGKNVGTIQSVYRGEFKDYTTGSGRIWSAGSGREFPNQRAFAAITSDGAVVTWGKDAAGGTSTSVAGFGGTSRSVADQLSSNVEAVYSNRSAFAALKSDGSVVAWGDALFGGDSTSVDADLQADVRAVYSTDSAFAALKNNGSVVTWGSSMNGGDASSVAANLSSNVTEVFSNFSAFSALKRDGSVVTWGPDVFGGDSSSVSEKLASNVTTVYASTGAFAALKSDGSVVTWGSDAYGGDSSGVADNLISNVTAVWPASNAFAALKDDGSVVTWGVGDYGGDSSSVAESLTSGVKAVYSTFLAFAAVKSDGSVVTWGFAGWGGDSSGVTDKLVSDVTAVYSSASAFAALKSDGSVVTWGDSATGGDSSSVADSLTSGVKAVYSTAQAFAAVKSDGSVVTWGLASSGGNSSGVAGSLTSGVTAVYSTLESFAALKNDGSVVTWGNSGDGGSGGPTNIGVAIPLTFPVTLHVRLAATASLGEVSGDLTLSSSGIASQTVALSGTVVVPTLAASSESLLGFEAPLGTVSASQTLTLSGGGFTRPLTVSAPTGFEVSTDGLNFSPSVRLGKNAGIIQSVYRGGFEDYSTAAARVWFAGNGHEFPNEDAFAAITSDGSVVTWGTSYGPLPSGLGANVEAVYSNRSAFAALKTDGSVVTWGAFSFGGNSTSVAQMLNSGVVGIASTRTAFAAMKEDGSVVTWGSSDFGGDSSSVAGKLSSNVRQVYSAEKAFAALKTDGSVVTWGAFDGGGVIEALKSDVTTVFSNGSAFAALKTNGSVVTWGSSLYGGNSSSVAEKLSSNVTAVYPTERAFAALKDDGSVVTWGDGNIGGNSSAVSEKLTSNVVAVYSSRYAFAALKSDGSVVTWGDANSGGNSSSVAAQLSSNVRALYSTERAFAALKSDGSVVTWGGADNGGSSAGVADKLSSNVQAIYSNPSAFAALKVDGSVVTWGTASRGGDSSSVTASLASGVQEVFSNLYSFAALKRNGSVVTWGMANLGGANGPANIGVAIMPSLPATLHVRLAATAPEGAVSGNLTLSSSGFATQFVALSGTVGGDTPLTPLQAWRQQFYGNPESLGKGADLAMPDGDGIENLIKYALCITPGADGSSALPELFRSDDNRLALRFRRDPARNDVDLIVEAQSNTLDGEWTEISRSREGAAFSGDAGSSEISNSDGTRSVEVKDTVVIDHAVSKRFLRVRVEASSGAAN